MALRGLGESAPWPIPDPLFRYSHVEIEPLPEDPEPGNFKFRLFKPQCEEKRAFELDPSLRNPEKPNKDLVFGCILWAHIH